MAQTLSNGYIKPQTGDNGSTFFPNLEANIQRLNDHNHNGTNSEKLTAASVVAVKSSVPAASWSSEGDGLFSQTLTTPSGLFYDDYGLQFRDSAGRFVFLETERLSTTTFKVFTNNDTLEAVVYYI